MRFVPPIPCWLVAAACLGCTGESTESPVAASDPAVAAVCAGRPASGAQESDDCAHPWSYVPAGLESTRAPEGAP